MTPDSCHALWIGGTPAEELALARDWAAEVLAAHGVSLVDLPDACAAESRAGCGDDTTPTIAFLAAATPARWTVADAVTLSRAWPLMPIVSVATSLVEGRRRSGPPLAGIEEVAWHDLPGRLEQWLSAWAAGLAGTLGVPATARRDERLLAMSPLPSHLPPTPVAVVAATPLDAEGLVDLLGASGGTVGRVGCGRPPLDTSEAVLIWDVGRLQPDHLEWLRLLSANRPLLRTVMVAPFLRGETARGLLETGAAAVLGRPLSVEALGGTLRRLMGGVDGLGAVAGGR